MQDLKDLKRCFFTGAIAGDRPPRYDEKNVPITVGRGPVPRQRPCTRPCSSGSPDPDPFVIRRSQTTEMETHRDDGARGGLSPALR